ncbi:MAG: adenylyl-sulfate kinase [Armatimonadota bacterium]|nr:adenylyl-sulfate kinase [Armatimonadota bacterium]MDR7549373.1 adenylyl-sulfate kinase [Armatimonadota bacterium]
MRHQPFGAEQGPGAGRDLGRRQGCVVWLTGLPGSGKTTIARALADDLRRDGVPVEVLDGDEIRAHLSPELGFSPAERELHNRRVIFMAKLLSRNGIVAIVALISPYRAVRDAARAELGRFVEVWVKCSVTECMRRDPKGHYRRALDGQNPQMTGVQAPYEPPPDPELIADTEQWPVERCVAEIRRVMVEQGYLAAPIT